MEKRIELNVEIEDWIGIGFVYRVMKGTWMMEEEIFKYLKECKSRLKRITTKESSENIGSGKSGGKE